MDLSTRTRTWCILLKFLLLYQVAYVHMHIRMIIHVLLEGPRWERMKYNEMIAPYGRKKKLKKEKIASKSGKSVSSSQNAEV